MGDVPNGPKRPGEMLSLGRLAALTDSIFGIAMTILVMNLAVPTLRPDAGLAEPMAGVWPMLLDFAISFGLLGIVWILNQRLQRHMAHTNQVHIWLTFGWMMCACLVPFTTSLMSRNPDVASAAFWYNAVQFALGFFLLAQCLYVSMRPHLLQPDTPGADLRRLRWVCASPCTAAGLAMVISVWSADWADLPYVLVPVTVGIVFRSAKRNKTPDPTNAGM